ncbi:unnamed protein product [Urochloa decumbens]|uniref:F-box domain-containing protein n=1 Tax=Urochloa decumbens TaxID=240449 RepID=A0ABC9B517_9POAL
MPRSWKDADKAAAASDVGGGADRLSELPDDALYHVLSFLPSDDAVRTSVLACRWRHLWKSTRSLRVTWRRDLAGGGRRWPLAPWTASTLTNFMNHLLLLRGGAPLDRCEILCGDLHDKQDKDLHKAAGLWIRHALAVRHARELRVCIRGRRRLHLDGTLFAASAPLLTTVELAHATFSADSSIDFSGCPVLEELTMSFCRIRADRIYSPSLTRLSFDKYCNFGGETRTRVSTPRLVSLRLTVCSGRAPVLDSMPDLVDANVRIEDWCDDMCIHNVCNNSGLFSKKQWGHGSKEGCFCVDEDGSGMYVEDLTCCDSCYGTDDGSSVLLEGLSGATDLELISDPRVFIFRKDCNALVFFLQRSPVLENLTLELGHRETRHPVVETDKSYSPIEQLFVVSKQLMIVEIKCTEENEIVKRLLILLTTHGVHQEQIHIEHDFCSPYLSGYDSNSDCDDYDR